MITRPIYSSDSSNTYNPEYCFKNQCSPGRTLVFTFQYKLGLVPVIWMIQIFVFDYVFAGARL